MYYNKALILASLLFVGGCATGHSQVEDAYGASVRSMIHNQIADPKAASNPDRDPLLGYGGAKGEEVLEAHSENVSRPGEPVNNEITLNIGK